jgi:Caspase domain
VDQTRSALIVASDEYTDPRLRRLRAPASDARALAAVLQDPGIGGFEVRTLLNEPAHLVTLAVEEFFADRRPGDLLLVHFSGHGIKDEDGELYFAAPNTMLGRLGATAVAAEFVGRRMNRSRSRRVVLLLDCCYAGAFERGLVARAGVEMGIEQQFGGRGRAVITASSAMEYAFEAGELADAREVAPSVFTSALVEGLETGEADHDQDGLVGLDELYDYVYDKVRAATPNQTPGKWVFGVEGDLYMARRARPVTTPARLPPELQQAIDSPLAGVRVGAVHDNILGINWFSPYDQTGLQLAEVPSNYLQAVKTAGSSGSLAPVRHTVANIDAAVNACRAGYVLQELWVSKENAYQAYQAKVAVAKQKHPGGSTANLGPQPPNPGPRPLAAGQRPSGTGGLCPPPEAFGIPAHAIVPAATGHS